MPADRSCGRSTRFAQVTETLERTGASQVMRRLVMPVYLPIAAGTFGLAMLVPVLPLYLTDSGLSLRLASVVLAAIGAGATIGGLPAGAAIARFGERRVMFAALVMTGLTSALLGVTEAAFVLIGLRLGTGAANVALRLSRQSYVTRRVGDRIRGRAMANIGGAFRMSLFVGPLIGGLLTDVFGFTTTFVVAGFTSALGIVPPLAAKHTLPLREGATPRSAHGQAGIRSTIRTHWRLLALVGVVPLLTMTVRDGRNVVVPLIGDDLGLSPTAVGALVTVGTTADLLLFPVAGHVMDRFGRLAAIVPSFTLIAVGLAVLGFAESTSTAVAGGAVIGLGNGLSSGSLLTLGSDLAPAEQPGPFLAAFGVLQDVGKVAGPLAVGLVGSMADLGAAALTLAAIMVVTIVWLVVVVGETSSVRAGHLPSRVRASPGS